MFKCKKVLLFPTKSQARKLDEQLDEHRHLYNSCLSIKKNSWENEKINVTCFKLIKSKVKSHKNISNYSSMQQTVRRLDKAFQAFFRRIKNGEKPGYPRFKNKDRFNTIEYGAYGDGNKIRNNKLYLQNIGQIKVSDNNFPKFIKKISITKNKGKYYANLLYEDFDYKKIEKTNKSVGIDIGLKTFIATSDGEKVESPKFHKQLLKEGGKVHRRIHRTEKGSKKREKHKKSLNKIKSKISNRRKDFNHKLSRKIINRYDFIAIEKIKLEDLKSDIKAINRTYSDIAWGQFTQFLTYKAENAGKVIIKVDPAYTTQDCSCCGHRKKKELKDRIHSCEKCGYTEDRDINAAKNILRRGLASLEKS